MKVNTKIDFFKLSPMIVLVWSLFSSLFISIIPIASGYGWDGIFYGEVAMNFSNMIGNIDSYHANRIFPGILIHYLYKVCNIPLNLESVLLGFQIYNITILVSSAIFWVLIAKHLSLKPIANWIGFCALFINYPMLNLHFYYPALTDGTAFFIGMIMLYSYLKKKNILLLAVTIVSYFCWPVGIIIGFLLFVYSNVNSIGCYYKSKKTPIYVYVFMLSPLLIFILLNFEGEIKSLIFLLGLDGMIVKKINPLEINPPVNFLHLFNSIFNGIYLVCVFWVVLRNFDLVKLFKTSFKKPLLFKLMISITILIVLIFTKGLIYSSKLPSISLFWVFSHCFAGRDVRFPFQFIIYHITYYGPIMILFILFFKSIFSKLQEKGLAIMFVFLYTVLFSTFAETRAIIFSYPFIVTIVVQTIDFSRFKNKKFFLCFFSITSLAYSKIWLIIKLPSSTYPNCILKDLDKFPMQWYFMNSGFFTNSSMYLLHAGFAILFTILFYCLIRTKEDGSHPNVQC